MPGEKGRLNQEDAQNEADILLQKIDGGQAKDYADAERQVEQEILELKEDRRQTRELYMIKKVFERRQDPEQRVENLMLSLGSGVLKSGLVDRKALAETLRHITPIEDEGEFVEKAYVALEPFYKLKDRPEVVVENSNQIQINDVTKYETLGNGRVELHMPATGVKGFRGLYSEGLRELAERIKDDPSIIEITADSWIIDKNPRILERFGFIVKDGEGARPWSRTATISKEEFLKKFLG